MASPHDKSRLHGWRWYQMVDPVRRWMDGLARAVQGWPVLSVAVRRFRATMRWLVGGAVWRSELNRARAVMADAPAQPTGGPKVLFVTLRGERSAPVAVDVTLAQGLRLRGARCEFFFCGGGLPICEMGWPAADAGRPCASCRAQVEGLVDAAGFPRRCLDDVVTTEERGAIAAELCAEDGAPVSFRGRSLDPLVEQSLFWLFRTATPPPTDEIARARRDFLVGAATIAVAAPRLLDDLEPDVIVMLNGLFYEDRIIREEAEARGIRVVTYDVTPQAGTLFFSAGGAAPDNDITEMWESEGSRSLSEDAQHVVDIVLQGRRRGTTMPHRYYGRQAVLSAPQARPVVAVLSNVSWDTAVSGRTLGFESMFDWVAETVRIAREHPELQFILRAHPAESQVPGRESRDRVTDFIGRTFALLPDNLQLIAPEQPFDSYALIDAARVVVVYTSTIGLEAAATGKPVCVAGRAHYGRRGFTTDITGRDHYHKLFDDLSWAEPDAHRHEIARRYAYLYFCRAMIPFPAVDFSGRPTVAFTNVADLSAGNDPFLDLICDGILRGGPIRLP